MLFFLSHQHFTDHALHASLHVSTYHSCLKNDVRSIGISENVDCLRCAFVQLVIHSFISIPQQYVYNTFILLSLSKATNCQNVSQRSENPHQNIENSNGACWLKIFACFFISWSDHVLAWTACHEDMFTSHYWCNNCKNWQRSIEQQFSPGHVMTEHEQMAKVRWHLC